MKMKSRNHINRDGQQPANVPPLFDPDLSRNLAAWVQKCFPDMPTIQPDEAIRLWLGEGGKDRPSAIAGTPVCDPAPQRSPRQSGIHNRVDGHRSDDQLAATLQRIAEMVTAALYNEQPQREPADVPVRHPIHWNEADQVRRISAVDFMGGTVAASSTDIKFDEIGHSTGNNGANEFTDLPHIAPLGSKGSEPGRYASPSGAKSNGTGFHRPDLEQSEEIGHATGNNGENV